MKHTYSRYLSVPVLLASIQGVHAKEIDEILVTATKRDAVIQDVPFSINAQSQADIERSGADSIEDIARNVAGLTIQNLGPGQSQVAIRGVSAGQIVRDQPGVKEQVGVYLDESVISLSLFTPDLDLFDLNRVETLRGPQGTLFGSGSVGGTIRYITNQPDFDETHGALDVELNSVADGEMGGHIKGMVNLPFENAALRLVGYHTEYGGYIDALGENNTRIDDVNSGARSGVRAALTFQPNDDITITPRLVYQTIETDGNNRQEVFNLFANPYTTTRPAITLQEREQYLLLREGFEDETMIADVTIDVNFDSVALTAITSKITRDILVSRDASALSGSVSVDLGFAEADVNLPSNLRDTTELDQLTQEIRLTSLSDGNFQWLAGIFYSDTDRVYAQRLPTPGYDVATDAAMGAGTAASAANGYPADSPFNSDLPYNLQQTALFGEASFSLSEKLTLTFGGRFYDYEEERTITSGGLFANGDTGVRDTTASDGFSPRLLVSYELNDEITFNAQAAEGFRLGGVNDPLNPTLCTPQDQAIFGSFQDYDDETMRNYEAGMKANYGAVRFNAAVFYADISDLQVTLDAGSCSSRISFNVPEAHSQGVEFEMSASTTDNLTFTVAASFVEAEFDSTVRDGNGVILGGVEAGNRLASVPDNQFSLSMNYATPLESFAEGSEWFINATVQTIGERITQPGDQVAGAGNFASGLPYGGATGAEITTVDLLLDPYTIANVNTGISNETYDLVLFIDNVTDENANLSFDRERGGRARLGFRTNQPRTIGANLRWRF